MKKFSKIDKIDLTDGQPKTFGETLRGVFEDNISIKIKGDKSIDDVELSIDGKEKFFTIVENLMKVKELKKEKQVLETVKINTMKNYDLNWINEEIENISSSTDKLYESIKEELSNINYSHVKSTVKPINEKWSSDYYDENAEDFNDDEYIKSFQYFVDTYINGQFGQLRKQLKNIVANDQIDELIDYLEENGNQETIKWVAKNSASSEKKATLVGEKKKEKDLSEPEKHQLKIAKKTLKMNDVGANIMGGMNKEEARDFLKKIGYSDKEIEKLEESKKIKGYKNTKPEIGDKVELKVKDGGITHGTKGEVYEVSDDKTKFKLKDDYGNKNDKWYDVKDFKNATINRINEGKEEEINSEKEFRQYANVLLKKAHGEDFDEDKATELIDGLVKEIIKKDHKWGEAIGILKQSLNDSKNESYDEIVADPQVEDEEAYLNSFEYFVETYINGQFSQLRDMLKTMVLEGRLDELVNYLSENGYNEIINWVAKNANKSESKKEDKINSEKEFRQYANVLLKSAHEKDFDADEASKLINDLTKKVVDGEYTWSDAVGILKNSLNENRVNEQLYSHTKFRFFDGKKFHYFKSLDIVPKSFEKEEFKKGKMDLMMNDKVITHLDVDKIAEEIYVYGA